MKRLRWLLAAVLIGGGAQLLAAPPVASARQAEQAECLDDHGCDLDRCDGNNSGYFCIGGDGACGGGKGECQET